jgi:hypothetical protein
MAAHAVRLKNDQLVIFLSSCRHPAGLSSTQSKIQVADASPPQWSFTILQEVRNDQG